MRKIVFLFIVSFLFTKGFCQTYNPEAAAKYAQKWCNGRNLHDDYYYSINDDHYYLNYDNDGGDCANFVSQCLIAGGLSLRAGTDGHGAYVKPEKVITGVTQLVKHLKKYQNTDTFYGNGNNVPDFHDVGDPMFSMVSLDVGSHSMFCSSLDVNANRLYSSHSSNACDRNDLPAYLSPNSLLFFHINNSIPAHCENCVKDADETGIDCGGSCPPCEHAPDNKVYTVANERRHLPAETYAISNITAQGSVILVPGTNVAFYSAGSIDLLPGFWAQRGSNFKAEVKKRRLEATADCNAYCDPDIYNLFCLIPGSPNNKMEWGIANADLVIIKLYQWGFNNRLEFVYENTIVPTEGMVTLWDLVSGTPHYQNINYVAWVEESAGIQVAVFHFRAFVDIVSCQGEIFHYDRNIYVVNYYPERSRSLQSHANGENIDMEAISRHIAQRELSDEIFVSKPVENTNNFTLYPNPTTGTLTISSSEPLQAFSDLTVTNSSGQTVYEQKYLNNFTLSLPTLPSGEYMLSVRINQQQVSQKVILQR